MTLAFCTSCFFTYWLFFALGVIADLFSRDWR